MQEIIYAKEIISIEEDIGSHWHTANTFLNVDVLKGKVNFTRQIGSKLYWRLEKEWLKEIKQLKAYLIWKKRKWNDWYDSEKTEIDYYQACEQINQMLINSCIKASRSDFNNVKAYLETHYLTKGKIDFKKDKLITLIRTKAHRIWETTGESNEVKNWLIAEKYVKMFYENIISAVIARDPEESTLMVLKAFQFSKAPENRYLIINCFEKALAIYFLNPDIIQDLWKKSERKPVPTSSTVCAVTIRNLPENLDVPLECKEQLRFDITNRQIIFEGVMTHAQKRALLDKLTEKEYTYAIERLFEQSRLLPRNGNYITPVVGNRFVGARRKYRCGLVELHKV